MSVILRTAQDMASRAGAIIERAAYRLLPPNQRERALENLRTFSVRNPKVASFLVAQTALAGLPILLFIAFTITTLVVSLITCIFLGVIVALLFTLLSTGFTFLLLVPVVFVGSCIASVAFLWGLLGYFVLQQVNGSKTPVYSGAHINNKMNGLTGGRSHDLAGRSGPDSQQESMVVDCSRGGELPVGHADHKTRSSPPHRRTHGLTNGSSHSGESREELQKGKLGNSSSGVQETNQGAQHQTHLTSHDSGMERAFDWKAEFQHAGVAA